MNVFLKLTHQKISLTRKEVKRYDCGNHTIRNVISAGMVFGTLVGWIVGALEGAVVIGGLSALAAVLYSIGIPKDSVMQYETALKSDKFLVIAHGIADEVAKAKSILETAGAAQIDVHQGVRVAG